MKALITGISGQDGSYLAELLVNKGYEVHGTVRRSSTPKLDRLSNVLAQITLHQADLLDLSSLINVIKEVKPDEVYNLAAQSFVATSFTEPIHTADVTGLGVLRMLEAIKIAKPDCKFYQASSSEQFGKVLETPQKETTPFNPRSPYGVAKAFGHFITKNYRESYDIHASCGILFNHESPRRGLEFVTRKITNAVIKISYGLQKELRLGNLDSKRDWGYAPDYVEAMWLMLQQNKPDDYIISSDENHTIREFLEICFSAINMNWEDYVVVDPAFFRPAEVDTLIGDSTKARTVLGWKPKRTFKNLVENMLVEEDRNFVLV